MKKKITTASWDALLDTDVCNPYNNADLTITLKLGFRQINPAAGAATGTYNDYGDPSSPARQIVKWTPATWTSWKNNFVKSAQSYWHGKFWLCNNFTELEFTDKTVKYRPNIWCRFNLVGSDVLASGHHHVIDVVKLHSSENWFGSHAKLFDSLDINSVRKGTDSLGRAIMQRAHVHEVGHLLGLGHVDIGKAHCPSSGNTNAASCYGVADSDKNSVMGQGMQLRISNANPWRRAMIKLTKKGTITNVADWKANTKRHYPRLPSEILANQHIITRPTR